MTGDPVDLNARRRADPNAEVLMRLRGVPPSAVSEEEAVADPTNPNTSIITGVLRERVATAIREAMERSGPTAIEPADDLTVDESEEAFVGYLNAREFAALPDRLALIASSPSGWRTMDSAPRDGTDFLARIPWQKKHHVMVGCYAPNGKFVSWPGRVAYTPDAWMPLPPPPVSGRAEP